MDTNDHIETGLTESDDSGLEHEVQYLQHLWPLLQRVPFILPSYEESRLHERRPVIRTNPDISENRKVREVTVQFGGQFSGIQSSVRRLRLTFQPHLQLFHRTPGYISVRPLCTPLSEVSSMLKQLERRTAKWPVYLRSRTDWPRQTRQLLRASWTSTRQTTFNVMEGKKRSSGAGRYNAYDALYSRTPASGDGSVIDSTEEPATKFGLLVQSRSGVTHQAGGEYL